MTSPDARLVFHQHSRTFSAAAGLLAPHAFDEIAQVYLFCRTVDDLADERPDPAALQRISEELRGLRPPSDTTSGMISLRQKGVPLEAAAQLVDGCRTDLGRVRVADQAELVRYAYLVAGTVGRITAPLLGVSEPRADRFAVDLGIAMQLSNIARDVGEDAARDRVYLPATWLREAGLTDEDVIRGGRDAELATVVGRLLDLAETYYASAEGGFAFLPWRPRMAVALAAGRYRAIGRKVRARGATAVRSRTVVGPLTRLGWLLAAPWVAALSRASSSHDPGLHAPLRGLMALGGAA
jgi:phytoene synthase